MRAAILGLLLLAGCAATPPREVTLRGGEGGHVNLPAGDYRFSWKADCESFFVEYAPDGKPPIPISTDPSGSRTITIPGPGYVNRGGVCKGDYTVTIGPAE
jgi:hypothetical protein